MENSIGRKLSRPTDCQDLYTTQRPQGLSWTTVF